MFRSLKRVCKSGAVYFWRNAFVSLSTILIMMITLFVVSGVLLGGVLLDVSLKEVQQRVDITVYFANSADEREVLTIKDKIEKLPEVKSIKYVSREEALELFKTRHENNELLLQALSELGSNPLSASLTIQAKDPSQYESIASFLSGTGVLTSDKQNIIDKITFFDLKRAIETLNKVTKTIREFGITLVALLAIVTVIIAFNTIRLTIYIAKDEISVMRLVGANNAFVQGPFVVSGIICGLVATMATMLVLVPVLYYGAPVVKNLFAEFNIFTYFLIHSWQVLAIHLTVSVALGAGGSWLAVRKYLKV
jgi:cell division transport system permease protein